MQTSIDTGSDARLLKAAYVSRLTTLSIFQLTTLAKRGEFPKPVALSERRYAWRESDVLAWIESRKVVG